MTINDSSRNGYSRPAQEDSVTSQTLRLGQRGNRAIRIAGCSGGVYDRKRAIHDMAKNEDVDIITGDWMSECNMTLRGSDKRDRMAASSMASGSSVAKGYEPYFLEELDPAIPWLAQRGVKLCANAGASDVQGLVAAVQELIKKHGVDLKVAWVDGDDVTDVVLDLYEKGEQFPNLPANKNIKDWGFDPVCAQCYLGSTGIAECFKAGADIVLCGRVSDASPTIGAAMWWYDWNREEHLQELASALMVGHIIECSTYATGGYYSGFKELGVSDTDMGYPIAILESNGEATITMEKGKDGLVNVATIASQLLYEIQGPLYFNSDIVASIEDVKLEQIGKNAVRFSGVKGLPAPSTTKVGITAKGGYQAEFHFYLTGLNIPEKAAMVERQTKALMGDHLKKFSCLRFMVAGNVPADPQSQEEATVDMRIFAQTRDPDILSGNAFVDSDRGSFARFCIENLLQGYPGSTMAPDMRTAIGRPFFEYWVALMPQEFVHETAHLPSGKVVDIPHPKNTRDYPREQKSYNTIDPVDIASFGPTHRAPLGSIVLGRSGDKSSNANLGLFVRHEDEFEWLRSLLSVEKIRELLGKDDKGKQIDRFEMPNIRAVHFLLKDHLDRGFNSTSSFDSLGKNLCEYIRARHIDVPVKFLERGRLD